MTKTEGDLFTQDFAAPYRFDIHDEKDREKHAVQDKAEASPGKSPMKKPFGTRSSLMFYSAGLVGAGQGQGSPAPTERRHGVPPHQLSHFDDDDESDGFESC